MTETKPMPHVIEQYKAEKDGLDVGPDIATFAHYGWEAIGKSDIERLKWWGVFLRRQSEGEPGYFMMRIRIPNGIATSEQLRCIAGISDDLGRGIIDITTRQQLQTRWIRINDVPEIMQRLWHAGLVTLQTGMDNIRNVVGCPLAGLTPDELFDASAVVRDFTALFVGNSEFTNLPRKFNVTITGCLANCTHPETQDIALVPATLEGAEGFNVLVGGKHGSGGYRVASSLDAFVTQADAAEVCAAIVLLFRDHGPREARNKARLSFLLDDWGLPRFRAALVQRLGRALPCAGRDERRAGTRQDHMGVNGQKDPDFSSVGLAVPVGRLRGDDLRALADVAERYGAGEVRLTIDQNAIIPNVTRADVDALRTEKLAKRYRLDPPHLTRGLVSCTGTDYCNLAQIDTKRRALAIAAALNDKVGRPVTLHWSGCQAGCGNHGVADVGVMGKKARIDGKVVEAADVFVGGSSGLGATPGFRLLEDVPCDDLEDVLETLLRYGAFDAVRELMGRATNSEPAAEEMPQAVFRAEDIVEGQGREYRLNGTTVAVFRSGGELYALQGNCPHADAPLAQGTVNGRELTCGEHGYCFDLKSGTCLTDPGLRARTFEIASEGDYLRVQERGRVSGNGSQPTERSTDG
jgi:ferredoxin-nitrite reductase